MRKELEDVKNSHLQELEKISGLLNFTVNTLKMQERRNK